MKATTFAKNVDMKINFLILSTTLFLFACQSESNKQEAKVTLKPTENVSEKQISAEQVSVELNAIASFLGGNQPKSVGDYTAAFNSLEWKNHQSLLNNAWSKALAEKVVPMRDWSKTEKIERKSQTLFYPFSGADFLHVYSAHSDYTSYYLFGLEPAGEIPKKENILNPALTSNVLSTIYKSVDENMSQSFFHTKYMAVEFNNPVLKGTIPVFMFFMNRMGVELTSIKPISFNDKGEIVDAKDFSKGVRIGFIDGGKNKELYYFSGDISDTGLKATTGLKNMINSISKDATTMMKSASYLCHLPDFSGVRDMILANSFAIMQDDTGIPFRFYDQNKWKIQHYGIYTQPIPLFASRGQADLRAAVVGKEKPIKFRYGYNNPPNLMVATKK
jgi:hypothetical protein